MPNPCFDVFLSHNSRDKPAVERIAEKLRQHRLEPWLDSWHLPAGKSFQDGIELGLKASKGCAYFVGGHGPGQWQKAELEAAQDRAVKDPDYQLFTVLLPGAPDPFDGSALSIFLANRTWVDLRGGFEDANRFQRMINAVLGLPMGPTEPVALEEGVAPYRGLHVFDEEHAEFFFGREADIQRLVEQLKSSRFLAVVGPSGSGKSSLVRAGLLPVLRNGVLPGSHAWPVRVFTPGARPVDALAAQLALIDPNRSMGKTLAELRERPQALDQLTTLLLTGRSATDRLVLVVDQFEEIFTLCKDDSERAHFLNNLLYAATVPDGKCVVILTMRADFYPRSAAYPDLATLIAKHQALLGPLDAQGLRAVIVEPARRVGVSFEPGLVDTILSDVGHEPGALPLLEHALLELWERRQGNLLTLAGYRDSGGVDRALAQRADAIFNTLSAPEQAVARRVLLRLTQPGEETEDTRRRAELDELITRPTERDAVQRVVDHLVAARLLTAGQQAEDGAVQVDVAHEALIRAWPRLRSWLDEDREGLRIHRRLTEAAQEWDEHRRDPDLLYRGARLTEAQTLAARAPDLLNEQETAFLAASVAARERELQLAEERRAKEERQRKRIFAGLALFSLVALVLAGAALLQWRRADGQTAAAMAAQATAEAQGLVAEFERNNAVFSQNTAVAAQAEAEGQAAVAMTAQAEAETDRNAAIAQSTVAAMANATAEARRLEADAARDDAEAQATIADTERANAERQADIARSRQLAAQARTARRPDLGLLLSLESLRYAPDSLEATGSLVTALVSHPGLVQVLHGHTDQIGDTAYSPDGRRLISVSDDGRLIPWDATTGEQLGPAWPSRQGKVATVAFSPDGSQVISAGENGTLMKWDVATGTPIGDPWQVKASPVYALAFSPDGRLVATDGADGAVSLWDVATGTQFGEPLVGHTLDVSGLAFSPDGTRLASTGQDATIRLWDVATGTPIGAPWYGFWSFQDLTFSPDGTVILASSDDGTISRWDAATGEMLYQSPRHHEGSVVDIEFSPDGTLVASAAVDGTVRIWDAATGELDGEPLQGHEGIVWSVHFSPDGNHLASSGADGTIVLWDLARTPAIATAWPAQSTNAVAIDFSPAGDTLVSGGNDGRVLIWSATTGKLEREVLVTSGWIWSVALSPDGERLAIADSFQMVTLWDVATGRMLHPMTGHQDVVRMVTFSPDGQRLASASTDGTVRLWDTATGAQIGEPWPVSEDAVSAVAFSPDGAWVATATIGGMVQIWSADGEPRTQPWQADTAAIWDVGFFPDGSRLVSAGEGGRVKLWDAESGKPIGDAWEGEGASLYGLDSNIYSLDFSPDGERLATAGAGPIVIWDVAAGRPLTEGDGEMATVWEISWSPDGSRLATAGNDGTLGIWEAETLEPALPTWRQPTNVQSVAFSPTGRHAASGNLDGMIVFWDVATGEPIGAPWDNVQNSIGGLAFTPDGRRLAAANLWNIVLWNATTGEAIGQPWQSHEWGVAALTFNHDASLLASIDYAGTVTIWDVATGTPRGEPWRAHPELGQAIAFSPDGTLLATAGRGDDSQDTISLWDVATRQQVGETWFGHNGVIFGLAFSHDGSWLLSAAADGTVRRWDVATGQLLEPPWRGHYGGVEGMALSADGRQLVTAHPAGIVLWDVATGEAIGEPWRGHDGVTLRVAFSPDGTQVLSSGVDGKVVLWDASLARWQTEACAIANRNLTPDEWRRYLGDEPYHETCPPEALAPPAPAATPTTVLQRSSGGANRGAWKRG